MKLLTRYLRPYWALLLAVVVFQLAQSIASLYLPTLNADIIDNGVATGDTGYILQTGGIDARHHPRADRLRDRRGLLRRARRDGARPRPARGGLHAGRRVLRARGVAVRRAVAHHPHHERRAAGADARAHDVHDAGLRPDPRDRRRRSWRCSEDLELSWLMVVARPGAAHRGRRSSSCGWCRCSGSMQKRIDRSTACCASSSPASASSAPSCASPSRPTRFDEANAELTDTALRAGRLFALMFPIVMLVLNVSSVAVLWFGAFRDRGRRDAGRLADRVPQLPHADPDGGHDGDVHGGA